MYNRLLTAFRKMRREFFLPPDMQGDATLDAPLPIGYGSTNSQPSTVKLMLEWLDVKPGSKILDVGSGSGWTTALLSYLTGPTGTVYALEVVPELVKFGRENCARCGIKNAKFIKAKEVFGYPEQAPYDRILVSASPQQLPLELTEQLANGGTMVIPVAQSILVIKKNNGGMLSQVEHPGFAFVPLIKGK